MSPVAIGVDGDLEHPVPRLLRHPDPRHQTRLRRAGPERLLEKNTSVGRSSRCSHPFRLIPRGYPPTPDAKRPGFPTLDGGVPRERETGTMTSDDPRCPLRPSPRPNRRRAPPHPTPGSTDRTPLDRPDDSPRHGPTPKPPVTHPPPHLPAPPPLPSPPPPPPPRQRPPPTPRRSAGAPRA